MIEYLKCQESELGGRGSHGGLLGVGGVSRISEMEQFG